MRKLAQLAHGPIVKSHRQCTNTTYNTQKQVDYIFIIHRQRMLLLNRTFDGGWVVIESTDNLSKRLEWRTSVEGVSHSCRLLVHCRVNRARFRCYLTPTGVAQSAYYNTYLNFFFN